MLIEDIEDFPSPEHARWGNVPEVEGTLTPAYADIPGLTYHPDHNYYREDWFKWRTVYEAGDQFVETYTKRFSRRESKRDFRKRKAVTPIPAFATGAINEIKNAIFQRLVDVSRVGGSTSYDQAIKGLNGGVDRRGGTLNWFIGHYILPELLTMKRVGVFVDAPDPGPNQYTQLNKHPYFYSYRTEDICNWNQPNSSDFTAVWLRDYNYEYDPITNLPVKATQGSRLLYINQDGYVNVRFYDHQQPINEITLPIKRIPFVCFEITESLMRNVANSQIALLNLESSDMSYALKGNFPFYTEQYNPNNNERFIKSAQEQYNKTFGAKETTTETAAVGASEGRRYPLGSERPAFINPSPEPLKVSMEKQSIIKDDIRKLVHLALSTVQSKAVSAESKSIDQQGLEAGLSYIGLELENGERNLAAIWDQYENTGKVATVHYPERWSLKTIEEIQSEINQYTVLRDDIPSATFKIEMNKRIVNSVLGIRVSDKTLNTINTELANAKGSSSDPKIITNDIFNGLVGTETASQLRGYPQDELAKAVQDHADRLARISAAQSSNNSQDNPAARGLPDQSANPAADAQAEKINKPGRGPAQ